MSNRDGGEVDSADVVVIGGGMAGLAAADLLIGAGRKVVLLEAAPTIGGLAKSVTVEGETIEAYYHHVFPQDRELLAQIRRLGLEDRLQWLRASTANLHAGRIYPFNTIADLLRYPPLGLFERIRLGFGGALALLPGQGARLDRTSVGTLGPKWFGRNGYAVLWQPLLNGKFGPMAGDVAMAWLVARMRQRAAARKGGRGDRLAYLRGGFGVVADRLAEDLRARGVDLKLGTPVTGIEATGNRWRVNLPDGQIEAEAVVAAMSGGILSRLVELPSDYRARLEKIPYRGVVCVLLELDRQIGRHYWTNLTQASTFDCLAVIEHTNFVPVEWYGGRHLVYLAHYVDPDGPVWAADEEALLAAAGDVLRSVNAEFDASWILKAHISRDRWAQPVALAGGAMPGLPMAVGPGGLFHVSLAHIYPDDRGMSLAMRAGERAGRLADEWLARRGAA
jgi:protoporphyrinogen oxidase